MTDLDLDLDALERAAGSESREPLLRECRKYGGGRATVLALVALARRAEDMAHSLAESLLLEGRRLETINGRAVAAEGALRDALDSLAKAEARVQELEGALRDALTGGNPAKGWAAFDPEATTVIDPEEDGFAHRKS
jgi:hypothetical protein